MEKIFTVVKEATEEKEYAALLERRESTITLTCFSNVEELKENAEVILVDGEKLRIALSELFPNGFDGKTTQELCDFFEKENKVPTVFFKEQQTIVKKLVKYFLSPKNVLKLNTARKYLPVISDTKLPFSVIVKIGKDLLFAKKKFEMKID